MNPAAAQLKKDLSEAIDGFAAMQQDELREIATVQVNRIRQWQENRSRQFEGLRSLLERLDGSAGIMDDPEFRNTFLQKMQHVLAGEADLREQSSQLQEALGTQLQAMRRGKKALHGYGPGEKGKVPRFLSSRT
jgi:hypothetical protein